MKRMRWLPLALVMLTSILLISVASAHPQVKTYTVNSNASDPDANPGNGICATAGGQCTLHAAIEEANVDGQASTIVFSKRFQTPNVIQGCTLPDITEDYTFIDASNRWDTGYDRPGVEIVGLGCPLLTIMSNNNTIVGLFFGGSDNWGVKIYGSLNIVGGYYDGQRNVFISGTTGVYILGGHSNAISNNYIGTINGQTAVSSGTNGVGIMVQAGDYTTIADNLIVGQDNLGIGLSTGNNFIRNNKIGISWNQTAALPNNVGIQLGWGSNNIIGPGNVIAGNTSHGVYIAHANNNQIKGNYIGSYMGTGNGGDGINLHVASDNVINEGNFIAYNTGNGIYADAAPGITIQGNSIGSNKKAGIYLHTMSDSQIGGPGPNEGNGIGGNESHGIWLETSTAITVTGNYIGLDQGAFDWGNQGHGILINNGSVDITVGGTNSGEPNWIGYNHGDGIRLEGSTTHHNYVVGNIIGAPINLGWEASNYNHGIGVYSGAHDNWIGWDGLPNGGNIILASGWSGLAIVNSNNNAVLANRIGTNGKDIHWGNVFYGITVEGSGNSIKGNEIAYNGTHGGMDIAQAGILVDGAGSVDNMITGNSIHDNDGPGIKLTNGANHNLAAPVITNADCNQVQGTACANCLIEIYSDHQNEGQRYEGYFTTNPSGIFNWNGKAFGPNVTALAIGPGSSRDTSPFSAPIFVGICRLPITYLPMVVK